MTEGAPLHYVLADGLTLGEDKGMPVLIVRKDGLPTMGVLLPDIARAALLNALAQYGEQREAGAPLLN